MKTVTKYYHVVSKFGRSKYYFLRSCWYIFLNEKARAYQHAVPHKSIRARHQFLSCLRGLSFQWPVGLRFNGTKMACPARARLESAHPESNLSHIR